MTKAEFISMMAERSGLKKSDVEKSLDGFINSVLACISSGESITLPGFGSFKSVKKAARDARNPRTGETIRIPEKNDVKFVPAKAFKDFINN